MRRSLVVAFVLLVCAGVGIANDCRFGAYESICRSAYFDTYRLVCRDMVKHGFRTTTFSGNANHAFGPTEMPWIGLARQVDIAVEEELVSPGLPVLTLSCDPAWFAKAKAVAAHANDWPELVCGNVDEPNYTQIGSVIQLANEARKYGVRNGTAIAGYGLYQEGPTAFSDGVIAHWLDQWIVLASTFEPRLHKRAHEQTANLCAYWAYERDADRDRYLCALWSWKAEPEQFLFWAYKHSIIADLPNGQPLTAEGPVDNLSLVIETVNGPRSTPAYEAIAEGIKDHELLDRLAAKGGSEAWLHELWESIPDAMPAPPKPVPTHPDWGRLRRDIESRLAARN